MTATLNGDREAAYERWVAEGGTWTIARVAAELDLGARQAGTVSRQWKERFAANGGSSASGGLPPRSPVPRAIAGSIGAGERVGAAGKPGRRDAVVQRRSRPSARRGKPPLPLTAVVVAAIGIVATVTFTVSYSHIRHLALESGLAEHAGLYPLGIDGLVIACAGFLMVDKLHGRRGPWLARLGVVLGLAGTIAGNVLAVPRDPVAMVGAGIMPAALAVVVHLGFRFLGREP